MKAKRIAALLLAVVMVFGAFAATAAAAVAEPAGTTDIHIHDYYVSSTGYAYENLGSQHAVYERVTEVCRSCGAKNIHEEFLRYESHTESSVIGIEDAYHEGVFHYYIYRCYCNCCGGYYNKTVREKCGPVCGGGHFSVPGENI